MIQVVEALAALLAPLPNASGIGARAPSGAGDMPRIGVAMTLVPPRTEGVGRIGREGRVVTRVSHLADPATDPNFASGGKTWSIPEPLARDRIGVTVSRNGTPLTSVTDPAPEGADVFFADPTHRQVRFGAPHPDGVLLEIAYPTFRFSEDIRPVRFEGTLGLTAWTADAASLAPLVATMIERMDAGRAATLAEGFLQLVPSGLGLARQETLAADPGPGFPAWQQRLHYRFVFERETGGAEIQGERIEEIITDMGGAVVEPPFTLS